jgi:hypothetical protein
MGFVTRARSPQAAKQSNINDPVDHFIGGKLVEDHPTGESTKSDAQGHGARRGADRYGKTKKRTEPAAGRIAGRGPACGCLWCFGSKKQSQTVASAAYL